MKNMLFAFMMVLFSTNIFAQKLVSGDFKVLKNQELLNVSIDYSSMRMQSMDATDFVNNNQDGIMEVTEKFVSEAYDKIMNRGISLTTKQETEYRLVLVATKVYDNGKTIAYLKLIDKNGSIVATSSEFSGKGGKWGSQINLMGDAAENLGSKAGKFLSKQLK